MLLAIDGTWDEARQLFNDVRQASDGAGPSDGPLTLDLSGIAAQGVFASCRRPAGDGCLSTLEAVAHALDLLEPPPAAGAAPVSTALLRPLLRMAVMHTELQRAKGSGVHRAERPGYRPNLEGDLAAAAAALGVACTLDAAG